MDKHRTLEAEPVHFLFYVGSEGESVPEFKSITDRQPSVKIMHKRSSTDNAIKLPVGQQ